MYDNLPRLRHKDPAGQIAAQIVKTWRTESLSGLSPDDELSDALAAVSIQCLVELIAAKLDAVSCCSCTDSFHCEDE